MLIVRGIFMKKINKARIYLEVAVAISIALALIMHGSAVIANETSESVYSFLEGTTRVEIKEAKTCPDGVRPLSIDGEVLQISGWAEGDDCLPSITMDSENNVFVTWENDEDAGKSNGGFAWNDDPLNQDAWFENGVVISLVGLEEIIYPDVALCDSENYELFGVFLGLDVEQAGLIQIPDVTDYNTWECMTWEGGAPEPEYAEVADGGWYPDLNYPDVIGPYNMYIYREVYDPYDIPSCPICFHTGIAAGSGVGYFDGQSEELTAPASDPDMVNFEDRFHTVVQYNDPSDPAKLVWKKVVPAEEPDYEYTPYQATITNGTNPAIAAYDIKVAIAYVDEGNVKCIYSDDDGETWETSIIAATGEYPDIYALRGAFWASYIDGGNLYVVNSTDGGATWNDPVQINDEDGTVVADENSVDIHEGGIVWTDSRGDFDNIYYYQLFEPIPEPKLEVTINTGWGLGASAVVQNIGDAPATNVEWHIIVTGGLLGLIDKDINGTILNLDVAAEETISSGIIFGFGAIEITATVQCSESSDNDAKDGTQLIILTKAT